MGSKAAWAISNATSGGSPQQAAPICDFCNFVLFMACGLRKVEYLVEMQCIKPLAAHTGKKRPRARAQVADGCWQPVISRVHLSTRLQVSGGFA